MKRKFKILGLSVAVAAILALVIAGTVGAARDDLGTGTQTQNQRDEYLCDRVSVMTVFVAIGDPTIMRIITITQTRHTDRTDFGMANKSLTFGYSVKHIEGLMQ